MSFSGINLINTKKKGYFGLNILWKEIVIYMYILFIFTDNIAIIT